MSNSEIKANISGGPPFGVRIKGGSEFGQPISVENSTTNGKAYNAGIRSGDIILSINGSDVTVTTHEFAKKLILEAKDGLQLVVRRNTPGSSPVEIPQSNLMGYSTQAQAVKPINQESSYKSNESKEVNTNSKPLNTIPQSSSNTKGSSEIPKSGGSGFGNIVSSRAEVKYSPYNEDSTTAQALSNALIFCEGCKLKIGPDRHVKLGNRSWHSEHFCCNGCNKNLSSLGFFEEKNKIYCRECYGDLLSPKCFVCKKSCIERYVTAQDRAYHSECFRCYKCNKTLSGIPFNNHENNPHCMNCINEILSINCDACGNAIKPGDEFLEASSKQYHISCFKCSICGRDLSSTGRYKMKDNKFSCPSHI